MREIYEEEPNEDPTFTVRDALIVRDYGVAVMVMAEALGSRAVKVPQDQIHDDSEIWDEKNEGPGNLVVKLSFARRMGWEKAAEEERD